MENKVESSEKEQKRNRIEVLMKQYEEQYGYDHLMKNYNYFYDKAVEEEYTVKL